MKLPRRYWYRKIRKALKWSGFSDALVIEARAQCRLADEYDAAQERGEVKGHGNKSDILKQNITQPTVTDIGLTSKQVHEARKVRGQKSGSSQ